MSWLKGTIVLLFGILVGIGSAYYIVDRFGPSNLHVCPKFISQIVNKTNQQAEPEANYVPDKIVQNNSEFASKRSAILMYHHIKINTQPNNAVERGLDVAPAMFEKQMDMLSRMGYKAVTLKQMTQFVDGKNTISQNIAITFDDGYDDIYTQAYPIMKKYGFVGTIYLIVDSIDKPGYMTKEQVKELIDAGFELGSHTLNHPNLANANLNNAKSQIETSKARLDKMFMYDVTSFCYPSGKYNDQVVKLIKGAGYSSAVTTAEGYVVPKSDLLRLPRLRVSGSAKFSDFVAKIFSI